MRYLWLAIAFVVGAIGILIGRVFKLSQPVTLTVSMVAMFLCLFKVLAPKSRFSLWALTAVIGAAVAWVLMFAFL
jgi:predicted branched-subunit amino acid permease